VNMKSRSLESSDLNLDGSEDLIMGAPVYSRTNSFQDGAVFVQLAQKTTGKLPFKTINLEEKADLVLSPPQDTVSSRFGHSVTTLDLNRDGFIDLVVSAPSYGLQNLTYQVKFLLRFLKIAIFSNIYLKGTCFCVFWQWEWIILGPAVDSNNLPEVQVLQFRLAFEQRGRERRRQFRPDHSVALRQHLQ
jgi:hypothetical protein